MTYARRVDANQDEIVRGLRNMGAFVLSLRQIGQGCPDILVGWRQRWYLFEIKKDARSKPNDDQKRWYAEVACRAPIFVVYDLMQAINIMQQVKP